MFEIPHNQYRDTCYRSDRIPNQPAPQGMPNGIGAMASRLPWGNTQQVIPMDAMMASNPTELVNLADYYQKRQSLVSEYGSAENHQFIRPSSFSKATTIALMAHNFGKGVSKIMSIVVIIGYLFFLLFDSKNDALQIFINILPGIFILVGIPLSLWLGAELYFKFFSVKTGQGAKWELNRETGLVTVYKNEHGQRTAYSRPFYEWDAYLITIPNRQGFAYYGLWLQHRYSDLTIKNLMDTADKGTKQEIWAMWDYIQNYMDITCPLPDVGGLELVRQYDPTTVEYDQRTQRNPYYWRKMSHSEWQKQCKEMARTIHSINMNRTNIMADYVDYSRM